MSLILHLETSTKACSVAISQNGTFLAALFHRETNYSHAEKLMPMVDQLLTENNFLPGDLSAVSVSKGPGSYTGLRIGVSTAKGICSGLNIPLIAISSLENLFLGIHSLYPDYDLYAPMIDARRMEVYTCTFLPDGTMKEQISAKIIDLDYFNNFPKNKRVVFFGDGALKCKSMLNTSESFDFIDDVHPQAKNMIERVQLKFNAQDFEDLAYFEPFYLKDFLATTPKNLL